MADYQEFSDELFPGNAEDYKSVFAREFIAKGEAIGETRYAIKSLTRLLQHRFKEIPSWAHDKISQADSATIEVWTLRILEAQSINDVFSE